MHRDMLDAGVCVLLLCIAAPGLGGYCIAGARGRVAEGQRDRETGRATCVRHRGLTHGVMAEGAWCYLSCLSYVWCHSSSVIYG